MATVVSTAMSSSKRSKNFTSEEDMHLCSAYVNVSMNPAKGCDQKSDTFWSEIRDKFVELCGVVRSVASLKNRFTRHIGKDTQIYNGVFVRCKALQKSGENNEDLVRRALMLFKAENDRDFKYLTCLPTLQKMPKFNPLISNKNNKKSKKTTIPPPSDSTENNKNGCGEKGEEEEEQEEGGEEEPEEAQVSADKNTAGSTILDGSTEAEADDSGRTMYSAVEGRMKRPIGNKLAKRKELQAKFAQANKKTRTDTLASMAKSSDAIAKALIQKNKNESMKNKCAFYLKLAEFHRENADPDHMHMYLQLAEKAMDDCDGDKDNNSLPTTIVQNTATTMNGTTPPGSDLSSSSNEEQIMIE